MAGNNTFLNASERRPKPELVAAIPERNESLRIAVGDVEFVLRRTQRGALEAGRKETALPTNLAANVISLAAYSAASTLAEKPAPQNVSTEQTQRLAEARQNVEAA